MKLRERHRAKERETQRLAAAEAKAQREAAKAQALGSSESGGWAQVAASKRSNGVTGSARSTPPPRTGSGLSGSLYSALTLNDDGSNLRKEKLVLRSGVGASKQARGTPPPAEVADSWEEEVEKEEREEEQRSKETDDNVGETETGTLGIENEDLENVPAAAAAPPSGEQVANDAMTNS